MTTVYFVDSSLTEPEAVECAEPGHPNKDAKGRTMFDNSHFATLDKAWAYLQEDANAGLSLWSRDLKQAMAAGHRPLHDAGMRERGATEERILNMPGPVSDSYDAEFGTSATAEEVREAIMSCRHKLTKAIGSEILKDIVDVVRGPSGKRPNGVRFTERELRVMRFALNRALESV